MKTVLFLLCQRFRYSIIVRYFAATTRAGGDEWRSVSLVTEKDQSGRPFIDR